jgi:hypothetical protein
VRPSATSSVEGVVLEVHCRRPGWGRKSVGGGGATCNAAFEEQWAVGCGAVQFHRRVGCCSLWPREGAVLARARARREGFAQCAVDCAGRALRWPRTALAAHCAGRALRWPRTALAARCRVKAPLAAVL